MRQTTAVTLSTVDLRVASLALAESARKRTRGDEAAPASRSLARTLAEKAGEVFARGEVLFFLSPEEVFVLAVALHAAAAGPLWYGSRTVDPVAPKTFRALAARLEA